MIKNRQVYGGPELEITKDLSFGKYVVDKLKENITKSDNIGLVRLIVFSVEIFKLAYLIID